MKKAIMKLIKLMVFGGIVFGGYQAKIAWEEFQPVLAKLAVKDPQKYEIMILQAKSLHFQEAHILFKEIDSMSRGEIIQLHHDNWRKKRLADKKFHEEYYDAELKTRVEAQKVLLQDYQSRMDEVRELSEPRPVDERFEQWKKTDIWRQRMILHEKCVKYVKMEIKSREVFRRDIEVSKVSTLMARLSNEPLPAVMLCNNLVPVTQSSKKIQDAILQLKETLSFHYYVQLLEEVGIPKRELFVFSDELKGRVRGYEDY